MTNRVQGLGFRARGVAEKTYSYSFWRPLKYQPGKV